MERGFGLRAVICFFIFLFLSFSISSFVTASCSLGATPLGAGAKVKPGTQVEVVWNFYNLYGDRTTHITVSKMSGPDWDITYSPELHVENYDVSGVIVNQTENVAVENYTTVLTIPTNPPEGWSYVKHPSMEGYIPVKQVKIYITVPDNAKLWQDYEFTFQAKGDCFSAPGAVIPAVATQLNVNITATTDFYEKPVDEGKAGTATGLAIFGTGTMTNILLVTTVVLVLVLFFLLMRGMKKSKRKAIDGNTQQAENKSDEKTPEKSSP